MRPTVRNNTEYFLKTHYKKFDCKQNIFKFKNYKNIFMGPLV